MTYIVMQRAGNLEIPSVFQVKALSLVDDDKVKVKVEKIISAAEDVNIDFWKSREFQWSQNLLTSERWVFKQIFV